MYQSLFIEQNNVHVSTEMLPSSGWLVKKQRKYSQLCGFLGITLIVAKLKPRRLHVAEVYTAEV
jgi:hypothetical protein